MTSFFACATSKVCAEQAVATVTRPAPLRKTVSEASAAAPVFPREPAINKTSPTEPLWALGARRDSRNQLAICFSSIRVKNEPDSSSINQSGVPIEAIISLPLISEAGGITFPIFGAVKEIVRSGFTHGPIGKEASDDKPDGISTEITLRKLPRFAPRPLNRLIALTAISY